VLPLVVASLVLLGACNDEPTAEEERDALVRDLAEDLRAETDGALDADAATCVAEGLVDEIGADTFDDVVAAAGDGDDPELRDQVIDVFASCDALEPILDLE